MKQIVLLLVLLMPFALFSQSKSNDVVIKKPMPANLVVSPNPVERVLSGNSLDIEVRLKDGDRSSEKLYSVKLSGLRSRLDRRLLLVEAQPVLLTLSNGKVLEFKTVGAGFKEVNNSYSKTHGIDDDIFFFVSREQIDEIIQGRIVNVRFALNGTRMIDYKVENNRFSEVLGKQLKLLDGNPQQRLEDFDRYIVPLQVLDSER